MVDMFTDKKEQRVSSSYRQQHCPPRRGPETFRQNRKDCYPEKRSSRETDQCAKLLMRQLQRCTNPSPGNGESISCNDLPESGDHLGAGASPRRGMIFAAKMRLDGNVNQFVITAEQCSIGITALRFVRHDRNHGRIFSDADLPDVQIAYQRISVALDHAANFVRQIRRCRRAIEQNPARIAQQCVSQEKTTPLPTMPTTGSSQLQPKNLPPVNAVIASTEVNASASTCRYAARRFKSS